MLQRHAIFSFSWPHSSLINNQPEESYVTLSGSIAPLIVEIEAFRKGLIRLSLITHKRKRTIVTITSIIDTSKKLYTSERSKKKKKFNALILRKYCTIAIIFSIKKSNYWKKFRRRTYRIVHWITVRNILEIFKKLYEVLIRIYPL